MARVFEVSFGWLIASGEGSMAWFIIQSERKTWTKYLVEAPSKEDAIADSDKWQYLGYLDGEDTESDIAGGPFKTEPEARADLASYIDG